MGILHKKTNTLITNLFVKVELFVYNVKWVSYFLSGECVTYLLLEFDIHRFNSFKNNCGFFSPSVVVVFVHPMTILTLVQHKLAWITANAIENKDAINCNILIWIHFKIKLIRSAYLKSICDIIFYLISLSVELLCHILSMKCEVSVLQMRMCATKSWQTVDNVAKNFNVLQIPWLNNKWQKHWTIFMTESYDVCVCY